MLSWVGERFGKSGGSEGRRAGRGGNSVNKDTATNLESIPSLIPAS